MPNLTAFLVDSLRFPSLILLHGNLGAGKTTLAKFLLQQLGIPLNEVKSPTYSLINNFQVTFQGKKLQINHLDLYRLEKHDPLLLEEIAQLLEEQNSLTLVEWPEKLDLKSLITDALQTVKIDLRLLENHHREITVEIKQ